MTKAQIKKAVKQNMEKYNNSLDQAIWMVKGLNPDFEMLIADAEIELLSEQLLGKI